ncbi:hypothetical protein HMPREF3213_03707 [Heyndrickxia coagulans]|uniref:Uncharacterized protein n=1 Tax=Heyndrickxia coagulans TaxID=1398 RepID=A0A133KB17_HEYCO|nr:hypothetical protein HMPREF3213_03707 [Heyndrickxia coagulans]
MISWLLVHLHDTGRIFFLVCSALVIVFPRLTYRKLSLFAKNPRAFLIKASMV